MIAIIDYKAGNIASVSNAFRRLGVEFVVTSEKSILDSSRIVIFPGVGHAYSAMQALEEKGLTSWLRLTDKPVLGICLGMQLLFESSEEGNSVGLGIIPGHLKRFDDTKIKVPHMGWNSIEFTGQHPLLNGLSEGHQFYFVHSYYAPVTQETLATSTHSNTFAAIVSRKNFTGMQFHPEKSGSSGETILRSYLEMNL